MNSETVRRMPEASPQETETSLAQRGLRGAAWNYGGAAVVIVGQLAYTALTARLVSPTEFGAYATAQALLSLVGYFTLNTVGNAIIRHPAFDRKVVATGLIMTGAAGTAVALFVIAAAPLWADVWRSPEATSLLRLFAPQVFLGALAIVPLSLLRRELRYRSASLIETTSVLVGFSVGGLLAVQLRSAEALVAGQVSTAATLLLLSALATRRQLTLGYSSVHARSLFSFSAQVSLQNLGHYVNNTLPSFVVSRSLGQASLGFFSRASLLVGLPLTFLAQGATKTLYPIFPHFRDRHEECRRMLVDVASVTTTAVWPLFAALAGLAPIVVELLLGAEWSPVSDVVSPLCLYAAVNFSYSVFASFTEAAGYLRQIWLVQACWTVALVVALGVAVGRDADMQEIVLAAAVIQVAVHVFQLALLARVRLVDVMATLRVEMSAGVLAIVWYIVTMLSAQAVLERSVAVQLVAGGGILAALALATWLALPHLPAGKALDRHGVRVAWRPSASRR